RVIAAIEASRVPPVVASRCDWKTAAIQTIWIKAPVGQGPNAAGAHDQSGTIQTTDIETAERVRLHLQKLVDFVHKLLGLGRRLTILRVFLILLRLSGDLACCEQNGWGGHFDIIVYLRALGFQRRGWRHAWGRHAWDAALEHVGNFRDIK